MGFRVGFESEFVLMHDAPGATQAGEPPQAVDRSLYCQASGFDAFAPGAMEASRIW